MNDGAAALIVMTAVEASKRVLARIAGFATTGVDLAGMGPSPIPSARKVPASRKVPDRLDWKPDNL